jgi:hypothetical protein
VEILQFQNQSLAGAMSRSFALIARVIAMRVNLFSLELTSDLWKQVCLLSLDRMAGFLFLMDGCKPFRRAYRL